jgi:hypothetical protein
MNSTSIASAPKLYHVDSLKMLLRSWLTPLSAVAYGAILSLVVWVVVAAELEEAIEAALAIIRRSSTASERARDAIVLISWM